MAKATPKDLPFDVVLLYCGNKHRLFKYIINKDLNHVGPSSLSITFRYKLSIV